MDIYMDIHGKSVDMDMDMDGKFHIHGKPEFNKLKNEVENNCRRNLEFCTELNLKVQVI